MKETTTKNLKMNYSRNCCFTLMSGFFFCYGGDGNGGEGDTLV